MKNIRKRCFISSVLGRIFIGVVVFLMALNTHAEWDIAGDSSISYVSIKNGFIAENNRFTKVAGSIADDGELQIKIDLASVETGIDIRNQRMRDIFFDVANYPEAVISAQIDIVDLIQIKAGKILEKPLSLDVSLHGHETTVTALLRAVVIDGQLYISTLKPVLISASDFGLESGVEALCRIAGLDSIISTIPVTVDVRLIENLR